MDATYFSFVTEKMRGLLASVLEDKGLSLFRRSSRVVLGLPLEENSTDYHLYFRGHQVLEKDAGNLRLVDGNGGYQVFKQPERIQVNYVLAANGMLLQSRIEAYDRLMAYFFDRKSVAPFVPEKLRQYPGLFDRLIKTPAEVSISSADGIEVRGAGMDSLKVCLEYRALYHSGTMASEESRVTRRVVNYAKTNEENERSVL